MKRFIAILCVLSAIIPAALAQYGSGQGSYGSIGSTAANGVFGGAGITNGVITGDGSAITNVTAYGGTNGVYGGVGLTNGVLTGNASGLTNVSSDKVSLIAPFSGLDNSSPYLGVGVKYGYGQGGSQAGYFSLNPMMFNQASTATKLVIAVPLYVTNAIQTVVWQSLYVSNNVGILVQPTVSYTTLTASNQNWIFITNNIGSITNLSSFWFAPYQDTPANRNIWIRTSIYAYLIP